MGDFILEGDSVVWVNKIDHGAAVNNQVIAKGNKTTIFKWNSDKETAAVLSYNRFKWVVIKREDKIGIRFRNLDAKTLTTFKGIERFPVDQKWKLKAVLEKPQDNFLMISNVPGQTTAQKNAGKLKFEIEGVQYSLDVIDEGELVDEAQDTLSLLRTYVDTLDVKANKERINTFLKELYQEAVSL